MTTTPADIVSEKVEPDPEISAEPAALEIRQQKGSVLSLTVANYGAMAINAATGPVMARALGPGGRGAVAAISVWDEASSRVFYLGLPEATGYRTKEGLDPAGSLLGTVRRVGFLLFPLALAGGLLVAHWPLGSLDMRSKILVVVLVAMSPVVNTFGRACYQLLMVERDMKSLRVATLIVNAVGFVVIVIAIIFGALAVWVAALALALGRFAENAYAWWKVKVKVKGKAKFGPMISFGVKAIPGSLTDLANNRLDQLFIIPFLGFRALGFYAVAVTVNFIPFQIGSAISSSAFGRVRLAEERGSGGVSALLIRRGFVATGAAAIAVAVATPTVLPILYGRRFDPSVGPTLILLPGTVAWALTLIATQIGNGLNKPQHASIAQLIGVVITISGLIYMVPRYGIAGAAIVSSVTYVARLVILMVLLRRDGVTGTTPRPSDVAWLVRRTQRIAVRPLRLAQQGRRLGDPPPAAGAALAGPRTIPDVDEDEDHEGVSADTIVDLARPDGHGVAAPPLEQIPAEEIPAEQIPAEPSPAEPSPAEPSPADVPQLDVPRVAGLPVAGPYVDGWHTGARPIDSLLADAAFGHKPLADARSERRNASSRSARLESRRVRRRRIMALGPVALAIAGTAVLGVTYSDSRITAIAFGVAVAGTWFALGLLSVLVYPRRTRRARPESNGTQPENGYSGPPE